MQAFVVVMIFLASRASAFGIANNGQHMMRIASSVLTDYDNNVMNTYGRYPLTISHGKGVRLYDVDGKG